MQNYEIEIPKTCQKSSLDQLLRREIREIHFIQKLSIHFFVLILFKKRILFIKKISHFYLLFNKKLEYLY